MSLMRLGPLPPLPERAAGPLHLVARQCAAAIRLGGAKIARPRASLAHTWHTRCRGPANGRRVATGSPTHTASRGPRLIRQRWGHPRIWPTACSDPDESTSPGPCQLGPGSLTARHHFPHVHRGLSAQVPPRSSVSASGTEYSSQGTLPTCAGYVPASHWQFAAGRPSGLVQQKPTASIPSARTFCSRFLPPSPVRPQTLFQSIPTYPNIIASHHTHPSLSKTDPRLTDSVIFIFFRRKTTRQRRQPAQTIFFPVTPSHRRTLSCASLCFKLEHPASTSHILGTTPADTTARLKRRRTSPPAPPSASPEDRSTSCRHIITPNMRTRRPPCPASPTRTATTAGTGGRRGSPCRRTPRGSTSTSSNISSSSSGARAT